MKEMGRQYGKLLSGEIHKMHDEIVRQYAFNNVSVPGEQLEDFTKGLLDFYPIRFQELARGSTAVPSPLTAGSLITF